MLYSRVFGKTVRDAPSEAKLASHKLLYKAGYIRDLVSGRYSLLPLGERVAKKIISIIEEEMDGIGAQRVTTPTFHPIELWQRSGRAKTMSDVLTRVKDKRGAEFALGATHEEVFVDLVEKFSPSERDLPIILYQFSNKFRDETRARGGLIRLREFLMKDAYSFNATPLSLDKTYEDMFKAYERIFERLGIKAIAIEADSGAIGGKVSHEFMAESLDGEDIFVQCNSCGYSANSEKAEFIKEKKNEDEAPAPLKEIEAKRGSTMEDGVALHNLPLWQQIKDVLFVDETNRFILAIIRGDFDVSEVKLARSVKATELRHATDEEIKEKLHSWPGFISPVGIRDNLAKDVDLVIVADESLGSIKNAYGGANKQYRDLLNMNFDRDYKADIIEDIALVSEGYNCAKCFSGKYLMKKGIEVGHVFRLDYYYSEPMNAMFTASDGTKKKFLMGCYGIGIERNLATIVEQNHDEKGIIWPKDVTPFAVHLISLNVNEKAQKAYEDLLKAGLEVLYDDREVSAGVKFSDYELIGIPVRLVVSGKTGDKIEYKERNGDIKMLDFNDLLSLLKGR